MQYPKEIKSQTIARYKSKESVISISNETGIPRSTIYRWLNESKNSNHPNIKDKEIKELERKVEKLQTMLAIIRELGISINAPLKEKLNAMAPLYGKYNVHWLCEANAEALSNKGIKEKPIEMSYHKGSDFNRFFRCLRCPK